MEVSDEDKVIQDTCQMLERLGYILNKYTHFNWMDRINRVCLECEEK